MNTLNGNSRLQRKSGFELLRIVAMLMIVFHHYAVHGVRHILNPDMSSLWLSGPENYRLLTVFFYFAGSVGVAVFFMLTGYFSIGREWKPSRLIRLVFQVLFYSVVLFFIAFILNKAGIYSFPDYMKSNALKSGGYSGYINSASL